jgi:beta-1,4-mannosyl-glycoprotein beta-1,4-N-acetylglucosaminyltransferase
VPRIYDCFIFFNELDLLEVRLHELDPVVDRFVLCEATATFRGKPKPLHFKENRERFQPFLKKIVHVVVDDMPKGRETEAAYFRKEKFQRNAIRRGLVDAQPEDFIALSDTDEILRASAVEAAARRAGPPCIYSFEMTIFSYFVNLRYGRGWNKARMARFGDVRTLERLRDGGPTWRPTRPGALHALRHWKRMAFGMRHLRPWVVVPNGGWHLTNMNGPEAVAEKRNAYSHTGRSATPEAIAEKVKSALASTASEVGPRIIEPDADLPAYLAENQSRFAHLFLDRQTFARYGAPSPIDQIGRAHGGRHVSDIGARFR